MDQIVLELESKIFELQLHSPAVCTSVGRFHYWLHKWGVIPMRPVSVAQKNKPLTISSCNVQSIDLPIDCIAWRSGRDNWMATEHLPRDLVQSSSGLKKWLKQRRRLWLLTHWSLEWSCLTPYGEFTWSLSECYSWHTNSLGIVSI